MLYIAPLRVVIGSVGDVLLAAMPAAACTSASYVKWPNAKRFLGDRN
jgi:hypothetical protein